ncbi:MAG TPA: pentapeptide repeat-containing protein [Methanothrix sp.]|nr:pentapeptide repeat-containing protein [Methanothrix sp.]
MEPDSSSDQPPVIQASKILAKIERGEDVEYDGVIVEGDLDISELKLPTDHVERTDLEKEMFGLSKEMKVISSQITIINSQIWGMVNFCDAYFQKSISFRGTKFNNGDANFNGTEFNEYANFGGAEFSGYVSFVGTKFGNEADFESSEFGGEANFHSAEFGGDAGFEKAKFSGDAKFTKFGGEPKFSADFVEAKFRGSAYFNYTKFNGGVYFTDSKFDKYATFWEAEFGGVAYFGQAQFCKKLDLGRLKFDKLYISWSSIKENILYDGPAYLALIKNFKAIEQFSDADDCYFQYRKKSQARKKWYSEENRLIEFLVRCYNWTSTKIKQISEYLSWAYNYPPFTWIHRFNWSKLLDCIGFVSCGYGVRIQPIILWVFGSVLGFTLIYKLLPQSYGGIAESGPPTVTMEAVNNSTHLFTFSSGDGAVLPSWGECLYFSFTALTGGTPDGLHPVGLCKYAVMVEGVLGYLFLALFVVVLARKIIR